MEEIGQGYFGKVFKGKKLLDIIKLIQFTIY